jgi:hypothetical protein
MSNRVKLEGYKGKQNAQMKVKGEMKERNRKKEKG